MMLQLARRRRPIKFRSSTLLGGASLVVGAGAVVQLPAAGSSLDFAGYNVLSAGFTVSGLSGGDSLVFAMDTVDPESAVAALLPSSLGRRTIATATTNAPHYGTIALGNTLPTLTNVIIPFMRNVLVFDNSASAHAATISGLFVELTFEVSSRRVVTPSTDGGPGLPASTFDAGGWLSSGGGPATYANLDEHVPSDTDYNYVTNTDGVSLADYVLGNMTDPGFDTGHVVHVRARDTSANGLTSILVNGIDTVAGAVFGEISDPLTNAFVTLDIPIAAADIAAITSYSGFRLQTVNNGGAGDGAGQVQVSWLWFEVPGNPIFG